VSPKKIVNKLPPMLRGKGRQLMIELYRNVPDDEVGWTTGGQLILNNKTIPKSNIINIMRLFTKKSTTAKELDKTPGLREFMAYYKRYDPSRRPRTAHNSDANEGEGFGRNVNSRNNSGRFVGRRKIVSWSKLFK
jgi:hypothetical protein